MQVKHETGGPLLDEDDEETKNLAACQLAQRNALATALLFALAMLCGILLHYSRDITKAKQWTGPLCATIPDACDCPPSSVLPML